MRPWDCLKDGDSTRTLVFFVALHNATGEVNELLVGRKKTLDRIDLAGMDGLIRGERNIGR